MAQKKGQTKKSAVRSPRKKRTKGAIERTGKLIQFTGLIASLSEATERAVLEGMPGATQVLRDESGFTIQFKSEKAAKEAMGEIVCEPNTALNTALLDLLDDYELRDPDLAGFAESFQ